VRGRQPRVLRSQRHRHQRERQRLSQRRRWSLRQSARRARASSNGRTPVIGIAMPADPHDHGSAAIPMPRLSDDAVVQIHDFLGHFLDLFEARYGDQIHRYYEDRAAYNIVGSAPIPDIDDPPF
jgi:hypothetical protein